MSAVLIIHVVGDTVASWLVCSSMDRAVRVRALAGDTVLCSWGRHLTVNTQLTLIDISVYSLLIFLDMSSSVDQYESLNTQPSIDELSINQFL